ncbi:MAG: cellulase family glycosylhydrolase [Phycisphaerae bacterium]|nr:cellulase family glycosylhydrolase [Phycisphaerae bacterium]
MRIIQWISGILLGLNLPVFSAQEMVPFPIPGQPNPESLIRIPIEPIRGEQDRIVVRDGHFVRDGKRIRLWGVNLSFGANFPTHAEAEAVAQRLADAGVNSVRCHHMDTSNYPRGLWNRNDGKTIEAECLDRLDFFINELAKRGIYADINLHVGRSHSQYLGLPKSNSDYDKIVNLFTPQLIDAQKQFARQMLDRVNPYRKLRYADDPAVAIVEITNENSFFMWDGDQVLPALPEFYGKVLRDQYNDWLKTRYGNTEQLRKAWNRNASPLGANLLKNESFSSIDSATGRPVNWALEQHETAKASAKPGVYKQKRTIILEIAQTDSVGWHLQFNQGGLPLEKGKYYTVILSAAAAGNKRVPLVVGQAHDPWQNLGLSQSIELGEGWKEFRFGFTATQSDANARLSLTLGEDKTTVYLAEVRLCPGGQTGLLDTESIEKGTVAVYSNTEVLERINDRLRFLAETEKWFFDGMRVFLKKDLGTRALVTGTIAFGPLGIWAQSDMDFIDSHSYWQHPRFPRRPWDSNDWFIDQIAMTDRPEEARLFAIASEKLAGKPFTLTEYNHPAPLDSQAECVPMVASFAAAQDWDGIWLYTYSHSGTDWNRQNLSSFFDIDTNPAKWGFMNAGAMLFRFGGLVPFSSFQAVPLIEGDPIGALSFGWLAHRSNMLRILRDKGQVRWQNMLLRRICGSYPSIPPAGTTVAATADSTRINWVVESGKGVYFASGRCGYVLSGNTRQFESVSKGQVGLAAPGFAVVTVTAMDRQKLADSNKILIAACGRCENTGMKFSADRTTVGNNWGTEPVRIEPVSGWIGLPAGSWKATALKPDGTADAEVPVELRDGRPVLRFPAEHPSMWYLLTR